MKRRKQKDWSKWFKKAKEIKKEIEKAKMDKPEKKTYYDLERGKERL